VEAEARSGDIALGSGGRGGALFLLPARAGRVCRFQTMHASTQPRRPVMSWRLQCRRRRSREGRRKRALVRVGTVPSRVQTHTRSCTWTFTRGQSPSYRRRTIKFQGTHTQAGPGRHPDWNDLTLGDAPPGNFFFCATTKSINPRTVRSGRGKGHEAGHVMPAVVYLVLVSAVGPVSSLGVPNSDLSGCWCCC
jgi:hypothetical protein